MLNIIGNGAAFLGVYVHLKRKLGIGFCPVRVGEVAGVLRRSLPFFYSRVATTVYTATNTVVLNIISGTGAVTGYYTGADKLITTAKSGMSPISDSMYPYMVKNRDFKLVKKTLKVLMPLIVLGCIVGGDLCRAPVRVVPGGGIRRFCEGAAGDAACGSGHPAELYSWLPDPFAHGPCQTRNYSTIVGSVFYIAAMIVLFAANHVTMLTLGLLTSATEILIFLYRLIVVWHYRGRMVPRQAGEEEAEPWVS